MLTGIPTFFWQLQNKTVFKNPYVNGEIEIKKLKKDGFVCPRMSLESAAD
jgi:hypothetical protein